MLIYWFARGIRNAKHSFRDKRKEDNQLWLHLIWSHLASRYMGWLRNLKQDGIQ